MLGQLVESAWSQAASKELQKQVGPCGGRTASMHRVRLRALSRHSGCMGPGRTPSWRRLAQGKPGSHHRGHAETARHRHQRQVSVPHSGVPSLPMLPPALPGPLCQRPMLRSTPPTCLLGQVSAPTIWLSLKACPPRTRPVPVRLRCGSCSHQRNMACKVCWRSCGAHAALQGRGSSPWVCGPGSGAQGPREEAPEMGVRPAGQSAQCAVITHTGSKPRGIRHLLTPPVPS